jgi:hypothetical protein
MDDVAEQMQQLYAVLASARARQPRAAPVAAR